MPRGDKSKYTDKQDRKADHIAQSYEQRGVPEPEAERRAWATVKKGGAAAAARPASARSASSKKAAATRARNAR